MVSFCLTVSHQTDQENAEDGNHMAKIKAKLKHLSFPEYGDDLKWWMVDKEEVAFIEPE